MTGTVFGLDREWVRSRGMLAAYALGAILLFVHPRLDSRRLELLSIAVQTPLCAFVLLSLVADVRRMRERRTTERAS